MAPTNQPRQGHALPSGRSLPPSLRPRPPFTSEVSQRAALFQALSSFPPGPLKNPRYPGNFRPDTQIPPQQGHRVQLCSGPNGLRLINHHPNPPLYPPLSVLGTAPPPGETRARQENNRYEEVNPKSLK
ncbi:unnamed protein product [Pleuronectes platessa]|uniref:Uncharacterized protein n=1 Tax=Pleuronectes platessa TaxID=8262 RepID=A0A9N7UM79_PLEPL|nr:unnamed protein product [Pleuronectes platessa]